MLCVVFQIHRNILSSQCFIRYVDDSNSFDMIKMKCSSLELELLLLLEEKVVKKLKFITPKDFFIPSSLSSDSESSIISGSTVLCRATCLATGQSVGECSFRLQLSGSDKFDQPELELNIDSKAFFKNQFKKADHWNLFCSSCGVNLPLEPVFIESVREYNESELSEGWFCHNSGPQQALHFSSQVLYLDDVSFYLYRKPNITGESTEAKVTKCSITDGQKVDSIDVLNTNCLTISHSDSNINSSGKNSVDCDYMDQIQTPNSNDFSSTVSSDVDKNEYLSSSKTLNSAINCQSCGNRLTSEKSPFPFIRFYIDKIIFKNASFEEYHLEYARNMAMLSFWSLVRKSRTSQLPSKLFFQSKVEDKELCLLLWVPSNPVAQFLLQDSLDAIPSEIHLRTEPVYKVLYFIGPLDSENVRSWRHDFGVDFYRVSDTMVKTLVEKLDASSSQLPGTSTAGGFSCGFLKAPSQLSN